MKRLLSAILCMAMLLGTLAVPAFAAPEKTLIAPVQKKAQPAFSWNSIPAANAGDGSTSANAIELVSGQFYDKTWDSSNDDQNCFFTFKTAKRGLVTLEVSKPIDSEGNVCNFDIYLFDAEGDVAWQSNTQAQANNTMDSYAFGVGLNAGQYFLCLTPGFQVKSGSVVSTVKYTFFENNNYEIEPNNNIYQATPMALNQFYDGVYGEQSTLAEYADWFSVKLAAGSTYKICLKGFAGLDNTATKIALVKPDESKIALKDELRKNVVEDGEDTYNYYEYKTAEGGKYYIRIYNYGGQTGIPYSVGVYGNPPVAEAPEITDHPDSVTAYVGTKVSFSVTATGASAYQWQYSDDGTTWVNCVSTGFNTRTFSFTADPVFHNRQYRCRVSNSGGAVYSNAAKLTVKSTKPVITSQPENVVAKVGDTVNLKVTASYATGYQWQVDKNDGKGWVNCVSSTCDKSTFSFTAYALYSGWRYRCVVSNAVDKTISNAVTLMVKPDAPVITTQPKSITVNAGAKGAFKVVSDATAFQWQYSKDSGKTWVNCTSATCDQDEFSFTAYPMFNGWLYRCKLSKGSEVVYTNTVKLTVNSVLPEIKTQPNDLVVTVGKTGSFSVTADNATTFRWQYSKDGGSTWVNCGSTTSDKATFTFTAAKTFDKWLYRCRVGNTVGVVYSRVVKLTVMPVLPEINTQPANQIVKAGEMATFSVSASNATAYQWQVSRDNGASWANCTGTGYNTSTFAFKTVAGYNGWKYRCIVSNDSAVVISSVATLTVQSDGPTITSQPKSIAVDIGATASFTVGATGATAYQWQYSNDGGNTWVNCGGTGYNKNTFSFAASAAYNGRMYRCKVSNAGGSVFSAAATLTVRTTLPTITAQPGDVVISEGGRVAFNVSASNATAYQWQRSVDNGATWYDCKGTGYNTPTFSFTAAAAYDGWCYRCKVSNNSGTVISSVAHLTVTP